MKYDDAEHCFLNFGTDRLPNEAGGTHVGMYLAWAASKGLLGSGFDTRVLAPLKAREVTGPELLFDRCDGKLCAADFNEIGNAFTASYYNASFAGDYQRVFTDQIPNGGASTDDFCSVPDTWDNFDCLAPMLDERFAHWQQGQAALATPAPARPPLPVDEDPAKAVEAIRARAKGGDVEAWFDLGVEYLTGQRVPRDTAAAADAFTRGAERGSVQCQFNLAVCFQSGDGRPQESGKALHWFSQAANGGHAEGLYQLAMAYRTGAGLPLDPVAANALMLLAQSKGSASAREAGVTPGTLAESTGLMAKIRQPGQLLLTLARRRMGAASPGTARPALPPLRPAPSVPDTARAARAAAASGAPVGGAAVIALLVGAAGFIVLLPAMSWLQGAALQAVAVALGAVAAFGAYRCSRGLGSPAVVAALLAVLAFVPVLGSLVCLALVLQIYRQHRAH